MEQRHEYGGDGGVKRVSIVDQTGSNSTAYGPEKYVVKYSKDKAGRPEERRFEPTGSTMNRYIMRAIMGTTVVGGLSESGF